MVRAGKMTISDRRNHHVEGLGFEKPRVTFILTKNIVSV